MTHLYFFRKIPEYLATDLLTGKLTKNEYILITYMLLKCDSLSGIIVTNSNLLSSELDIDRKRVSNMLSSLKRKKRIQNPDGTQTEIRQKRGSTKPYPIYLLDHIPYSELDRDQTEARQGPDGLVDRAGVRRKNEKPSKPAPNQEETENGKFLASEIRSDIDIDLSLSKKEKLVCQSFSKACGQMWQPQTDMHREAVTELAQTASEEQLTTIAERAVTGGGVQPSRVIGWFRTGIKKWAELYGQKPDASGMTGQKRDDLERALTKLEGEFAIMLVADASVFQVETFGVPIPDEERKHMDLERTFGNINRIREVLGRELMDESILEMDDAQPA